MRRGCRPHGRGVRLPESLRTSVLLRKGLAFLDLMRVVISDQTHCSSGEVCRSALTVTTLGGQLNDRMNINGDGDVDSRHEHLASSSNQRHHQTIHDGKPAISYHCGWPKSLTTAKENAGLSSSSKPLLYSVHI